MNQSEEEITSSGESTDHATLQNTKQNGSSARLIRSGSVGNRQKDKANYASKTTNSVMT
jgi:hypothetical protein